MPTIAVIADRHGYLCYRYRLTYGQSRAPLYRLPPSFIVLLQIHSVTNGTRFRLNTATCHTCTTPLSKINVLAYDLVKSGTMDVRYCNDLSHHDQCLEEVLKITINSFLVSHVQGCTSRALPASASVNNSGKRGEF